MTASHIHLIRHGEVDNPYHVVYADLPGYALSALGHSQAAATAEYLAEHPLRRVISSPLLRARQTADAIARPHGLAVESDPALTEWTLSMRWAGVRWDDLEEVFPGELVSYLDHPDELAFAEESLADCGDRVAAVARAAAESIEDGHVVIVGHQDPTHAAHIALTAAPREAYNLTKPGHASVTSLTPAAASWELTAYWEPDPGVIFPPIDRIP